MWPRFWPFRCCAGVSIFGSCIFEVQSKRAPRVDAEQAAPRSSRKPHCEARRSHHPWGTPSKLGSIQVEGNMLSRSDLVVLGCQEALVLIIGIVGVLRANSFAGRAGLQSGVTGLHIRDRSITGTWPPPSFLVSQKNNNGRRNHHGKSNGKHDARTG